MASSTALQNTNKLEVVKKHISRLAFHNPGPQMISNLQPVVVGEALTNREMRKVTRKMYTERARRNQQYDDEGRTLIGQRDVCDCLQPGCPGCHYPCPRCGSGKCAGECRCARCWVYGEVEVEGTGIRRTFDAAAHWSVGK